MLFDCAFLVDVGWTSVHLLRKHRADWRVHLRSDEEHRYNKHKSCKVKLRKVVRLAEKSRAACKCRWYEDRANTVTLQDKREGLQPRCQSFFRTP